MYIPQTCLDATKLSQVQFTWIFFIAFVLNLNALQTVPLQYYFLNRKRIHYFGIIIFKHNNEKIQSLDSSAWQKWHCTTNFRRHTQQYVKGRYYQILHLKYSSKLKQYLVVSLRYYQVLRQQLQTQTQCPQKLLRMPA